MRLEMEFDTSRNVMKFFLILPFDIFLKKRWVIVQDTSGNEKLDSKPIV